MEEKREKQRRAAPRKIRHRKKMEVLRASAIQTDPEPLAPEEGLVCMGEGCWIYNLLKQEYSNEYCAGVVISQSVSEGSYVLYGSSVDLTVSAGRKIERLHPFRGDITEENGEINESVD